MSLRRRPWPIGFEDIFEPVDVVHLFADLVETELRDEVQRRLVPWPDRGHETCCPIALVRPDEQCFDRFAGEPAAPIRWVDAVAHLEAAFTVGYAMEAERANRMP